jgi:hypothetical protein
LKVGTLGKAEPKPTAEKKDLPPKPYSPPRPTSVQKRLPSPAASTDKASKGDTSEIFGDGHPFGDPSWYQRWHTPYYNESHRRLRAEVREWVSSEIEPNCYEWVFPILYGSYF